MKKSSSSASSSDPQTFALRSLPTRSTHPTPTHADPDRPTSPSSAFPSPFSESSFPFSRSEVSPEKSHGSPPLTLATTSHGTKDRESIQGTCTGEDPDDSTSTTSLASLNDSAVPPMTKSTPSLLRRSSPNRTYGALGRSSRDAPGDPEQEHVASPRSAHSNGRSSRRKSSATENTEISINMTKRFPGRKSLDEVGGSSVAGGLEGRFGVAEAVLPTNLPGVAKAGSSDLDDCEEALLSSDDEGMEYSENDPPDNSPYSIVRSSVPPTDNTTLSINTPRMWTLSVLFSVLGSATNLFFSLRYPSVAVTPIIALLSVHPLGLMWDYFLKHPSDPEEEFIEGTRSGTSTYPGSPASSASSDENLVPGRPGGGAGLVSSKGRLERLRLWLSQGRWNEKEHACVYVSSNVSFGFAFATDVIVEQTMFYKQEATIPYQFLLIISTQILGYAFAGLTRRFLVRPSGMLWPGTLASASMFSTLHQDRNDPADGWKISRGTFFFRVWMFACSFYFLPGLLFPALSYFNVVTWFAPKNVVLSNLFGVVSGLGMMPLTFDWAQIAYIGSPLVVPFWAAMNVVGGLVIVMWILAPVAYYCNVYFSSYMPILSASVFDNTGKVYDVSKILTKDFVLDRTAYKNYSRVFLPITYVLSYGIQFAGLASLISHTICWHGKDIVTQCKRSFQETGEEGTKPAYQPVSTADGAREGNGSSATNGSRDGIGRVPALAESRSSNLESLMGREDVHNRLMKRYRDAPLMWYLVTFISMTAIGIFVVEYYPVHLPWYGIILALAICGVLFIPIGIIMAVTNQQSSIYLICQLICGVLFPGRPVANMVFVTYGYISSAQGIKFAADLKLGHYMKIPPRLLFSVQMVATLVASVTQLGVLNWMFGNVPGLCTPGAINGFTCPIARVHFNGSILWGVVGPKEFFGPGATYRALVWAFPIGLLAPVPLWWYTRRRERNSRASGTTKRRSSSYSSDGLANFIRKINFPVLFGSLSWIPPATGLNFSVWALTCWLFNYHIKRRWARWWDKYVMTLSAALDSGLAFGIVVVFFGFVYPGLMKGFKWWGTEVYKMGCDWQACAFSKVGEGEHFGPDTWAVDE